MSTRGQTIKTFVLLYSYYWQLTSSLTALLFTPFQYSSRKLLTSESFSTLQGLSFEEVHRKLAKPTEGLRGGGGGENGRGKINYSSKLAGKKVLIIRSKYDLNTQKCNPRGSLPLLKKFSTRYHSLTVNNHLYFQLALLIRRRRYCLSGKNV